MDEGDAMSDDSAPPATGGNDDDGLGDAGKRALQAERDRAKKAEQQLKQARDELAELKKTGDATKSAMDKVLAKLEAAEERSQNAEQRALHGEVVAATGLSMAKVARLKGGTVEELMADAEEVFDWKPADDKGEGGPTPPGEPAQTRPEDKGSKPYGRPRENLTADPGAVDQPDKSPQEIADAILSRPF